MRSITPKHRAMCRICENTRDMQKRVRIEYCICIAIVKKRISNSLGMFFYN